MLVLFETAAGYAVFKLLNEKKLNEVENLYKDFETLDGASKVVKLKAFRKFEDTTEALAAATALVEGKMSKMLKKMLRKLVVKDLQEELLVADAKLGNAIKDKLSIPCVTGSAAQELMRCLRAQANNLITGLEEKEMSAMSLGLAHSLSRYKLKFSPDKVDTMIVQAISLLDDLDKELNNYSMRAREWYGWHFPELGKIVQDNMAFARLVLHMGDRTNAVKMDLSKILTEELEQQVKEAAEISMGTEVSEGDIENIKYLCTQVVELSEYRLQLYDYIKNRMMAIAPNLHAMVGELVGARLIAHAGSLLNLAKHPASTVQILGAEKALFRALKTKHNTPKYGLIYHASLVSQTNPKYKGKMSRMLAAKAALAIRIDALGEDLDAEMGIENRAKLEARIKMFDSTTNRRLSGRGKMQAKFDKYENKSEVITYNTKEDSTLPGVKRKLEDAATPPPSKKIKKEKMDDCKTTPGIATLSQTPSTSESGKKKKKKSKVLPEETPVETPAESEETPKKKKRKSGAAEDLPDTEPVTADESAKKKKKKKKDKDQTE